jgi:ceramide glucosyltransferase
LTFLAVLLAVAGGIGVVYQLAAMRELRRFVEASRPRPKHRGAVSVLKPLCGDENRLVDNLRTFCEQDYPEVQIVFGVADPADPALTAVGQLVAESPAVELCTVVESRCTGRNRKVGNLLNMLAQVRHDVLVIADSDVRVEPGYLNDVMAAFGQPEVGLVTALYVGRPIDGLWSRLGAMGINHGFLPSALVARALGRRDGCFGATMALRQETLQQVGGLEPLKDVLADDWALGAAVRRAGWTIGLSARPVDLVVAEPDLKSLLAHEIRWGRTIAAVDRPAYCASVITQPVVLTLFAALLGGPAWWWLVAVAALARLAVIRREERLLRVPRSSFGELALREVLNFVVFVAACCGRSVLWRGQRFRILRDGKLELLEGIPG